MNPKSKNRAWVVAIIAILTGVFFAASKSKINGAMVNILEAFEIDPGTAGWLSSLVAIVGLIIAVPAGSIMSKFGPRKIGIIAIVTAIIGNFGGGISGSFYTLLAARFIESIGIGLIALVVPALITAWFPSEKRGLPMGIWSAWVGMGSTFILQSTKVIVPMWGWQGMWWYLGIIFVVMLVLFVLLVKMPEDTAPPKQDDSAPQPKKEGAVMKALLTPTTWILALVMGVFAFGCAAAMAFTPVYLQNGLQLENVVALNYASIMTLVMIIAGFIMGSVLNALKNYRPQVLLVCMIFTALGMFFLFKYSASMALMFMVVGGAIFSMVPAIVFTLAPETSPGIDTIGATMGIVIVGQSIGGITGPILVGGLFAQGWSAPANLLGILGVVGVVLTVAFVGLFRKKSAR